MSETPAEILLVSEQRDEIVRISQLLKESDLCVRCHPCRSLDELRAACDRSSIDLILCRYKGAVVNATEVNEFRQTLDDAPDLILLADNPTPEDYLQAGKSSAMNLVDLDMPAQFDFALRRALESAWLRRRYREARRALEDERVIDDSRFTEPQDRHSLPPIAAMIDEALSHGRMELLFQPILSVTSDRYENHEIFLRIQGKDGYLMPGEFLPSAERYGLMPTIDRWVVEHAIKRFKEERRARRDSDKPPLRFFINISLHSLVDPVAIEEIVTNINDARLPAGSFVIEVDKGTILSRLKKSKTLNRSIKKMRLQFAMDHYEMDDTSLNYLKHVDLDYIKLKRELIRDIQRNSRNLDQVRQIVEIAHESGMLVVASQIEKAGELAELYEAGVDLVQGYLIAEPSSELQEGVALDEVRAEEIQGD